MTPNFISYYTDIPYNYTNGPPWNASSRLIPQNVPALTNLVPEKASAASASHITGPMEKFPAVFSAKRPKEHMTGP
jgi:hypothetical protein